MAPRACLTLPVGSGPSGTHARRTAETPEWRCYEAVPAARRSHAPDDPA
ncbi:hypothetical protein Shyd_76230 [Streptomyces hydrogenans]|uniref:Uncharacterized protein n=1 Tax=Streptomyces hydrogenans TaxID=1873719 RepID=A0ABQ3PMM6_9ACTN|nr:hypothetical protein GCM10018784_14090 [Streptomyces hydrogenans]GHI26252.1 hypothetical protein Shyd_76230 [Streptomyces hydrogenans]